MSEHKEIAAELLKELRRGTPRYKPYLGSLVRELHGGGLSLRDLGTDYAAVKSLLPQNHKKSALMWLRAAHEDTERRPAHLQRMRLELRKGGFTLESFGKEHWSIGAMLGALA